MDLAFTKMQALGNDFVVIDATRQPVDFNAALARRIADRRHGVGCDQILLIEPSTADDVDFGYRIINADGSEVGQCGNGVRCVARYVWDRGLSTAETLTFATPTARMTVSHAADPDNDPDNDPDTVAVDMGEPDFDPAALPMHATPAADYALEVDGRVHRVHAVSVGNPHVLLVVDDIDAAAVGTLGPRIESHPWFPDRVNVGFAQVDSRSRIRLRVWERGAGETQACGSGACAAVAMLRAADLVDATVTVTLPGGTLEICWSGPGTALIMRGGAETVFDGRMALA